MFSKHSSLRFRGYFMVRSFQAFCWALWMALGIAQHSHGEGAEGASQGLPESVSDDAELSPRGPVMPIRRAWPFWTRTPEESLLTSMDDGDWRLSDLKIAKASLRLSQGDKAMERKEYDQAAGHYLDAVIADARVKEGWQGLGNALLYSGHPRGALKAYQAALRLDSHDRPLKSLVRRLMRRLK